MVSQLDMLFVVSCYLLFGNAVFAVNIDELVMNFPTYLELWKMSFK